MSKLTMLKFYYQQMMRHYGPERLDLLYTDTDSFVFNIKVRKAHEDWRLEAQEFLADFFDFSNLPPSHPAYSNANKGVLMKFKDEAAGGGILEWIGLRSKMYSMRFDNNQEIRKAKGIKQCAVKKRLKFEDYYNALYDKKVYTTKFSSIRSFKQKLYTVEISKISLSCFDDKRHICPDGVSTKAHGHYSIMDIPEEEEEESV